MEPIQQGTKALEQRMRGLLLEDRTAQSDRTFRVTVTSSSNQQRCFILDLPVELVINVMENLAPAQQLILARTCRSFRNIALNELHDRVTTALLYRAISQQPEFLYLVARDFPNHWICEVCRGFHDISHQRTRQSCQNGIINGSQAAFVVRPTIMIEYSQVQIALKYARIHAAQGLDPTKIQYLKSLLSPTEYYGPMLDTRARSGHSVRVDNTFWPRVIRPQSDTATTAEPRHRYLVLSTWVYNRGKEPMLPRDLGVMSICPHVSYPNNRAGVNPASPAIWQGPLPFDNPLGETVLEALDGPGGIVVHNYCRTCNTDYSVSTNHPETGRRNSEVVFKAWYDLGPEGPWDEAPWQSRSGAASRSPKRIFPPGGVREMYSGMGVLGLGD